jgi:hypothetical protein
MPSTFVPNEPLTPNHPLRVDPADRHSESPAGRSEGPSTFQIRYDLFRSPDEPELYCAVPEDRPAPAFLGSEPWQVAGQMAEADPMPLGFDRKAARIGVCLNGFYLFVAFSPIPGLESNGGSPAVAAHSKLGPNPPGSPVSPLENRKNASYHQRCQGF